MGALVPLVAVGGLKEGTMTDQQTVPHGILCVGSALKRAGYDVELYHIPPARMVAESERLARRHPLFVGFSVFTGLPVKYAAIMSRAIKAQSDTPVVWGGVHPSMIPEDCLKEPFVDIVVLGEGEVTAVEVAQALEKGRPLAEVRSIGFKKDGKMWLTPRRELIHRLDDFPVDWSLIDLRRYLSPFDDCKRGTSYVSSRGCPHHCAFCYLNAENSFFEEGLWRSYSADFVLQDLQRLKDEYNVDFVNFYDDNFFVNKRRAFQIIENMDLPWWGECVFTYVSEGFAKRVEATDCRTVFFGLESGSDRILKAFSIKGLTVEKILTAVRRMAEAPTVGIKASGIVGFPTETPEEVHQTLKLMVKLAEIHPNIHFNFGLCMPYPGTPVYEHCRRLGFKPPERIDDWAMFDIVEVGIFPAWLPWADERTPETFRRMHAYADLFCGREFGPFWREFPPVKALRLSARRRLLQNRTGLPYELYMENFLLRHVIPAAKPWLQKIGLSRPWWRWKGLYEGMAAGGANGTGSHPLPDVAAERGL